MLPALACVRPSSVRMIVVLPAPLGPRKPNAHAARHLQVDAVERGALAEALGQAGRLDRQLGHSRGGSQLHIKIR